MLLEQITLTVERVVTLTIFAALFSLVLKLFLVHS